MTVQYHKGCACCGSHLMVVAHQDATTSGRMSVRCTHCPAGGDILADGTEVGPALEGAKGAQAQMIRQWTPRRETAEMPGGETA